MPTADRRRSARRSRLKPAALAHKQRDDLVEAGNDLCIERGALALLLDSEIAGDLTEPRHQGLEPLLGSARRRRWLYPLSLGVAGDHGGIDPVSFFQEAHRLGKAAYAA